MISLPILTEFSNKMPGIPSINISGPHSWLELLLHETQDSLSSDQLTAQFEVDLEKHDECRKQVDAK